MTGATAMGTPCFSVENQVADGTLKDAIYQLSKNQCDLNDMFKEVIMDFQVRMLDNQSDVCDSINDIKKGFSEISETFKLMMQVMDAMGKKLVAMDERNQG